MIRDYVLNDSHPLIYMRINATLAQFKAFVDFYGIKEGVGIPASRVAGFQEKAGCPHHPMHLVIPSN